MTPPMLTQESFQSARRFIETTARPLEIARLHHAFDGGPGEAVFDALGRYQNADGGYGHALDPDLRAAESSALCTSIAFQVVRATRAEAGGDLAAAGMAYFLQTLDQEEGHWRIIPRSAERSPHAPWWNQAGREDTFDVFSLNPTAEILGYLYDYRERVPADILSLAAGRVISHLSAPKDIRMHDLLCCLRLLQTRDLPEDVREPIRRELAWRIDGMIVYDPARWEEYGLRPLQVVPDPGSPWMAGREAAVAVNLDYEIASQRADGSWAPTWSWGDAFPNDWPAARREWAGVITLEKLLLLKRHRRIAGLV